MSSLAALAATMAFPEATQLTIIDGPLTAARLNLVGNPHLSYRAWDHYLASRRNSHLTAASLAANPRTGEHLDEFHEREARDWPLVVSVELWGRSQTLERRLRDEGTSGLFADYLLARPDTPTELRFIASIGSHGPARRASGDPDELAVILTQVRPALQIGRQPQTTGTLEAATAGRPLADIADRAAAADISVWFTDQFGDDPSAWSILIDLCEGFTGTCADAAETCQRILR